MPKVHQIASRTRLPPLEGGLASPLPKEIQRKAVPEDRNRYQTVYAQQTGAVVAPTAGLHFTPHLLKRLELKGSQIVSITLHIGLGTLRPVDVEDLTKYKVDSEFLSVSAASAQLVNQALNKNKRVCAVGVSTAKAVEDSVAVAGGMKPNYGWTNKFIFPPYSFKVCTSLTRETRILLGFRVYCRMRF